MRRSLALGLQLIEEVVQRCSVKKGVLRNSTKFTGKHLCQSLFFNKFAGLRPATSSKKRLWHRRFPVNFVKFLSTHFSIEHLRWLPPNFFLSFPCYVKIARLTGNANILENIHLAVKIFKYSDFDIWILFKSPSFSLLTLLYLDLVHIMSKMLMLLNNLNIC